jgi:cell division protein FtsN
MKATGNLAVFVAIAAILMVSTSFSERLSMKTWAPNAVMPEPKPIETGRTLAAKPNSATMVPKSDVEKAALAPDALAPEQRASGGAEPPAAVRSSTAMTDPDATATLPTQPAPELSATRRPSKRSRAARAVRRTPAAWGLLCGAAGRSPGPGRSRYNSGSRKEETERNPGLR